MAKHAQSRTNEQHERLELNRKALHALIAGDSASGQAFTQTSGMTLTLERIVINRTTQAPVPYEGSYGVARLLAKLAETYVGGTIIVDGHIVGVRGALGIEGHDEPIDLEATVGMGAQLSLRVGPSTSIRALADAVRVFDRQVHLAYTALGQDFELCTQGYNPNVQSPSDIVPVPLAQNVLVGAHLARTGRYSRDAVRCTAATIVSLPMDKDHIRAADDYRLCAALSPILSFLTDNTLHMRGGDPYATPRMARMYVWQQTDPARCGIVPGTFSPGFGLGAYERWIEQLSPIVFVSDEGVTFSTGDDTCAYLMQDRDLSTGELSHLLSMAWPDVRWNGRLELRAADSLPLRLACGYVALVKGIFASDSSRTRAKALLSLDYATDNDVFCAWNALREQGWSARVYGRPIGQVANELSSLASRALEDREERRMLDALSQLWEVRMVPRDTLLRTWERTRPRTSDETAVELYGEGAVIPFDKLEGEPPAGSTSVMPVLP